MDVSDKQPDTKSKKGGPSPQILEISEGEANNWLDGFKHAWESRNLEAARALFTPDARYRERRFGDPLLGYQSLESYWRLRVFEHQRDICFDYQLWGVRGNELMARWQASYTWLPINGIIRMDGVCNVVFSKRENDRLKSCEFNEWFDLTEV
jgi:hypothetical protein